MTMTMTMTMTMSILTGTKDFAGRAAKFNRPGFLRYGKLNSYGEYLEKKAIKNFGKVHGASNPGVIIDAKDLWFGKVVNAAEHYYFETYLIDVAMATNTFSAEIECEKIKIFTTYREAVKFSERLLILEPMK